MPVFDNTPKESSFPMSQPAVWPAELFADIDRDGPVPLYHQISERLESAITGGHIQPGDQLETEIAISERLGISRPTVRRAIQTLVDKGMLVRRQGVGTQVVQRKVSRAVGLTSLKDDLSRTGHAPTTTVLECELISAPADIAQLLGVDRDARVTKIRRLRCSDDAPLAVMVNYLPESLGSFTAAQLTEHGLYEILRARGVNMKVANQTIGARLVARDEFELLGVSRTDPVITMERVAYDESGAAVEVGRHCYRADRYRFETTLVKR